jgi:regulator of sigma E protease
MGWKFVDAGDDATPVISAVKPGGPADVAGLRPGDRLRTVANAAVATVGDVRRRSTGCGGEPVPLTIERDGATLDLSVACTAP